MLRPDQTSNLRLALYRIGDMQSSERQPHQKSKVVATQRLRERHHAFKTPLNISGEQALCLLTKNGDIHDKHDFIRRMF
jgi:hypothetical protein